MKPSTMLSHSFWCGFLINALINMFFHDWIGLEEYLQTVQNRWVNIHWAVWIPLLLLVAWWYLRLHAIVDRAREVSHD